MRNDVLLTATELRCRLDGKQILRGVDIQLRAGELHCLVGPNGAGKTTLMHAIIGLNAGVSGEVEICGRATSEMNRKEMARCVALVPQGSTEPLPFTIHQFVLMGRYAHLGTLGRYSHVDYKVVDDAMRSVGIYELSDRTMDHLSGGERQRAVLARSLAQDAPLMLLDEPTAYLDADGQAQVLQLMRQLVSSKEKGVLAVTHDLNLAAAYADYIHLLKEGRIHFGGRPKDVLRAEVLESIYRTPLEVITDVGDGKPRVFVVPTSG